MAEHNQRIHPVLTDVEAPPPQHTATAPLIPTTASKSDVPAGNIAGLPPLPRRAIPVTHSRPPRRKRSCLCRCFCWTLSLILILIIAVAIAVGILYLVFRPKLPNYSIDKLRITEFNLTSSGDLSASFAVKITATNPNSKIGIYYEGGSRIEALYEETKLCEGSMPKFYQGHKNTTSLDLSLSGQTQNATGLINRVEQQVQDSGNVGLDLKVKQPVRIKLGKLKLFTVKFRVSCTLTVDNLSTNTDISIKNSSCKFRHRLW